MTHSRAAIHELLATHGLSPSRALGQNFVADANTVRRIARLAGVGQDDRVVEIGAGLGSLTLALAETGAEIVAVEIDRHLQPVLREVVEPCGVTVVAGDARSLDWNEVLGGRGGWKVVANLPYNVATPMVLDLLEGVPAIDSLLVMVQAEVGERLAARAGEAGYGIPSVKLAWWADAKVVGRVPSTVFVPQPRVESALVDIRRHDRHRHTAGRQRVFALIDAGFGQRRKMLRRSLASVIDPVAFAAAGVRPEARAEELALDDWVRLAAAGGPAS